MAIGNRPGKKLIIPKCFARIAAKRNMKNIGPTKSIRIMWGNTHNGRIRFINVGYDHSIYMDKLVVWVSDRNHLKSAGNGSLSRRRFFQAI